jgi:alpha,alpha-trehalase
MKKFLFLALALAGCASSVSNDTFVTLPVEENLGRLLELDRDHDRKITVRDGAGRFAARTAGGDTLPVEGAYPISVLLQELSLAKEEGQAALTFRPALLRENPVIRTGRLIRELYWDGLTRRLDGAGLAASLPDSKTKTKSGKTYLYVPAGDEFGWSYYRELARARPELNVELVRLPRKLSAAYLESLNGRHGLLALKVARRDDGRAEPLPYVVPGGRFNEMYGWDSYFIVRGLLLDGKAELARAMVENHAYQIQHYGKILNANRTYYLSRTQPPFFTSMLRAVYEAGASGPAERAWLKDNLGHAIDEYRRVWASPPRLVKEQGLSRYFDEGEGPGPEVEEGAYDAFLAPFAKRAGLSPAEYLARYESGQIRDEAVRTLFKHDRTVRETGHDTTYRFDLRAADFLTVDLNALLYKYETDIADLLEREWGGKLSFGKRVESASAWRALAARRKARMQALLWDEQEGFYFDYDLKKKARSGYVSATALYALWAGLASPEQARKVAERAERELLRKGGLAATSEASRGALRPPERPQRQWDYPYGWPPHQILAWEGLARYDMRARGERWAEAWVSAMTKNARDFNGMVTEKYDVEKASHEAFAEYGNVGSQFSYITKEGFGWTNASYQLGTRYLAPERLRALEEATVP